MNDLSRSYHDKCKESNLTVHPNVLEQLGDPDQRLRELNLPGNSTAMFENRITNRQWICIAKTIVDCSTCELDRIDLRYNELGQVDSESDAMDVSLSAAYAMAQVLQGTALYSCQLTYLDLRGNTLDAQWCKIMCSALLENETVEVLNLNGNPIGNAGGLAVAEVLEASTTLLDVDLGNTDQQHDSIVALSNAMSKNKSVERLSLESPLKDSKEDEASQHIAKMLQTNTTLKSINLGKHHLTDHSAQVLSERLLDNSTLHELNLRANKIGSAGCEALAALLMKQTAIKKLDLSANRICCEGARALGAALECNETLECLKLNYCSIADKGLQYIAMGMKSNAAVRELYIWGNEFAQPSAHGFFELERTRFAYYGIQTDIQMNPVDDSIHVAQRSGNWTT